MVHRKLMVSVVGILALLAAAVSPPVVALAQSATASAKKAIQEVLVANDSAHPVPVQTQGTSEVQVVNMVPVLPQGTADVNVVHVPTVTPVQKIAFGTFAVGSRFSDEIVLYTVPAGKLLIIEGVSIASNLTGPDQHLTHVLFSANAGDVVAYTINTQPVAEGFFASTGANIFRATQQVTAYAAAGTDVTARGTRDGNDVAHLDSLQVGFAGRLVDVP
ncbi:MAG TPA: hypothetical protein VH417_12160 [Vicinamibacterales bacterium]|jgi:hypothetical protein